MVGDIYKTQKRIIKNNEEDIKKININIDTFCSFNNISKKDLFDNGEKHIYSSILNIKNFPILDIAVIAFNGTSYLNITNQCIIDYINGKIEIHEIYNGCIFSLLYSIKKVSILKENPYKISPKNEFGVFDIKL